MKVLVLNSGSSSLKFQLFVWPDTSPVVRGTIDRIGEEQSKITVSGSKENGSSPGSENSAVKDHHQAFALLSKLLDRYTTDGAIDVIGHRVVHGGDRFALPAVIDAAVVEGIRSLCPLAPLHNPPNLAGIEACLAHFSESVQVAVFDTAFHQTLPEQAYRYAIPEKLYSDLHLRRYGFHGTSHGYVARQAAEYLNRQLESTNLITLHLGNGASACAVRGGKSIDTSMGLTPLEGLVMGTRSGDIDPAVPFFLAREAEMPWTEIELLLNSKSGLRGICGSNDMRDIQSKIEAGDGRAKLALDIFCYRIKKYIGSYAAILGSLDALVFTAGIGEHSSIVRERACSGLELLGIKIDPQKNSALSNGIMEIQAAGSKVAVLIVPTNEELEIARQSIECLTSQGASRRSR